MTTTSRLNKYDTYKNSGIEWIGVIPESWKLSKYKYFARSGMGDTILSEQLVEKGIPVYSATQEEKIFGYVAQANTILRQGDFVIPARGNSIGCITFIKDEIATCTQTTIYSKLNNICNKYLFYCCCGLKDNWFEYDDTAIPQITVKQVQNNLLPLPDRQEQHQIADYLDKKCGEIDRVVETQKDIIEKLKEYKQSIITEAVARGLDKSTPLKDSGIEWIGKIPKHCELRRLKTTLNLRNEKVEYNGEKYIGLENVPSNFGRYSLSNENIIDGISNKFYSGDVLFGKLRPYLAKATIVDFDGLCSSEFLVMQNYKGYNKFLLKILLSYWFIDIVNSSTYGAKMPRASWEFISNMVIPFPDINEQKQIADYLDKKCSEIDSAVSDKEQLIKKLTEYKKSLIYECVTGKRKVVA